jgi:hypothetical protein
MCISNSERFFGLPSVALFCALAGCQPQSPAPASPAADLRGVETAAIPLELTLAEQMAAIERGASTRILVEQEAQGDQDLIALGKLSKLTDLLLDHAASEFHADGVAALADLPDLQHLRIRGRGINAECLRELAKIKSLRILNVPHAEFADEGLEILAELPNLESLRFGSSLVTDEGMKTLARFPAIRQLHLIDVPITDAGLAELAKIDRLQSLYIDGGNISDAGWDELFRKRPRLHVHVKQQHLDRDPHRHPH